MNIDGLFADYAAHHRAPGNVRTHLIGIPMIAFSLLGLLSIELFSIDWPVEGLGVERFPIEVALLLVLALAPLHIWLDARLGVALTALYLGFYFGARLLSWQINVALFVVGWVFQFIGHVKYEHRSPALFTNLLHLFVGPLWVLNHLLGFRKETGG